MADSAPLLLVASALLALGAVYLFHLDTAAKRRNPSVPLAPGAWPVVGHLPRILVHLRRGTLHDYSEGLARTVGDFVLLRTPFDDTVLVTDAAVAKAVLADPVTWNRGNVMQELMSDVFTHALFIMPSDKVWKQHRHLLQPSFGPTHLRHTAKAVNLVADELLRQWDALSEKASLSPSAGPAVVDAHLAVSCAALDIIGRIAFSHSFGTVKALGADNDGCTPAGAATVHEQFQAYDRIIRVMAARLSSPKALWWATGCSNAAVKPAVDAVVKSVAGVLEKREREGEVQKEDAEKDVLDRLLGAGTLSGDEIRDEMIAFFLAGFETTANTLANCMLCVATHPEVMRKLQDEADTVLRQSGGALTYQNLSELKYTEQVIKETLRLHPTIPLLTRLASHDATLGGRAVRSGTWVVISVQGLHRKPEYWESPLEFDPDRWSPERERQPRCPGAFLPFGDGQHNCIGKKIAMIETTGLLAKIAARFEWKIVPGQDLAITEAITAGLRGGLAVELRARGRHVAEGGERTAAAV